MTNKTTSETLFEKFCAQNDVHWMKIPVSSKQSDKTPDYRIECEGIVVIAEVKEFDLSPDDKARLDLLESRGSTGSFEQNLDDRVRNKIDAAMPQLRKLAKGKYPAIIVLYNNVILFPVEGLEIRLAMYGQDIVEIGSAGDSSNPSLFIRHRFGGG